MKIALLLFFLCLFLTSSASAMKSSKKQHANHKKHHLLSQPSLDQNDSKSLLIGLQTVQESSEETVAEQQTSIESEKQNSQSKQVKSNEMKLEANGNTSDSSAKEPNEFSELESYQMKFFVMSLLAILTVVSCCLGMQYILNFVTINYHQTSLL